MSVPLYDDMWEGIPAFVVGGGPSLKDNLAVLPLAPMYGHVIVTNRAIELPVRASMWTWVDPTVYKWAHDGSLGSGAKAGAESFTGLHVTRKLSMRNVRYPEYVIELETAGNPQLGESLSGLVHCHSNVGFFALNMAYLAGADPIVLIGFDQRGDPETDKQAWWHDGYPHVSENPGSQIYTGQRAGFELAAATCAREGRRLWNASPGSSLDCIEEIPDLMDTFDRIGSKLTEAPTKP